MANPPFSVVSWNVNSIRVRLPRVLAWLETHQPEVLCLQETKVEDSLFPQEAFSQLGYHSLIYGQKSYNGVALLSKRKPDQSRLGFQLEGEPEDPQARLISARFGKLWVMNAYAPQGTALYAEKYGYKLGFFRRLKRYFEQHHTPEQSLLLLGDFNVAPEPLDVYSEEAMEGQVSYYHQEKEALAKVVSFGLVDQFRLLHPKEKTFSWWDYRGGALRKNHGLRIDHLWASQSLSQRCTRCWMDVEERKAEGASDHVPVLAEYGDMKEELLGE